MNKEGRFQVSVGAIIEHSKTGKLLFLRRTDKADFSPGIWEEITGRMKQFEEPEDALKREVMEEAGIEVEIVKPLSLFHVFRGDQTPENELVGIIFWCRTDQDEIKISGEHSDYRWVDTEEALKLIDHPGMKSDIQAFIKERCVQK